MNYYPHHIGDYSKDTAHLTMLEDAAYRRMLDIYYASEKPLPLNQQGIYRLVRARSLAEKQAVDIILGEFFVETPNGWRNARADLEIAKAQEKSGKAKASASVRWQSERNANASDVAMRTHSEGNAPNNQEPIANNQEKEKASAKPNGSRNGAHHVSLDSSPVLAALPLREGGEFPVHQSLISELEPIYPHVDVPKTLQEMRGWLLLNSSRRKTRTGIKRFIGNWLQSEEEKHGG